MTAEQETVVESEDGDLPGIDMAKVEAWLQNQGVEIEPPLELGLIAAGGSNLTYRVIDRVGSRFVLRRPPVGPLLPTAHDMAREHRIMAALAHSEVPVPEMLALCQDESITGAPFYLMRYVEGNILRDQGQGEAIGPTNASRASSSFIQTMAAIHTVEPAEIGLGGLSKPAGYVERQLRRWLGQYEQTAGDQPDSRVTDVHGRLAAHLPEGGAPRSGRLVHGDYHIDNVVFDDDYSAIAVLDWELCALGDPLADVAWALMFWATSPDELSITTSPATYAEGFLDKSGFIEQYGRASGEDLRALPYFRAFSHWKLACLMQGSVYRRAKGQGGGLQAGGDGQEDSGMQRISDLLDTAADFCAEAGI